MKTEVNRLESSRVRVEVEIPAEEISRQMEAAAKSLAGEMKIPGFRKGKVPPQIVTQRIGREAVLDQAIRNALPDWYERAVIAANVTTVGEPKLDLDELPAEGDDLRFSLEIDVRPPAELGEYRGIEVGRAEAEAPDEAVEAELERLREGFGSLNPVERAAAPGDVLVIDYEGTIDGQPFDGSSGSDFAIELGAEGLLEEFDAALPGHSAGEEVKVEVAFPDDHQPAELAGKTAEFAVTLKEVREKVLPELDDEFATQASEFDTLDELRDEIRARVADVMERQAEAGFLDAAVDAAAANAEVEVPHDLVHSRAHEMWDRFERTLSARGIEPATFAQMQGKTREELVTEHEESAQRTLRREATLEAVADAEGIEADDEEMIEALGPGEGDQAPEKILDRLRETGRDGLLRQEVRMRKAAKLIAAEAKPIPLEQAEAREAIWTPEDEEDKPKGELWTPGS